MLRLIWTPSVAASPDAAAYKNASDTLTASYGDDEATASLPRDPAAPPPQLDALTGVIRSWLAARTVPNAPVKLMLHGYDFDPRHPGDAANDPFMSVYAYPGENGPNFRLSWLPLVEECDNNGAHHQETAIAFAWTSTGSMAEYATAGWSESYEYACVDLACIAARAVAAVLGILAAENVAVDVLAHSLGTRLFTQAVRAYGGANSPINNVILLDGAEFSVDAAATFAEPHIRRGERDQRGGRRAGGRRRTARRSVAHPWLGGILLCRPVRPGHCAELANDRHVPHQLGRYRAGSARRAGVVQGERRIHADPDIVRLSASAGQPQSLGLLHRIGQSRLGDRSAVEAERQRRRVGKDQPAKRGSGRRSASVRRHRHPDDNTNDDAGSDGVPAGRATRRRRVAEDQLPAVDHYTHDDPYAAPPSWPAKAGHPRLSCLWP